MQGSKRFIDWINLLLGIWLIISPWILGTVAGTAGTVMVVMGIALVAFSVFALFRLENSGVEWWNFFVGILLFVMPWMFNYTTRYNYALNSWIVGIVVAVLSLITIPLINGIHSQPHEHNA